MRNSFASVQIIIIWVLLCAIKMMMTKKTSRVEHYHHHYLITIRPWRTERARVREGEGHFCWIKLNNEKSRKLGLPKFDMNKHFSTFFFFLFFPSVYQHHDKYPYWRNWKHRRYQNPTTCWFLSKTSKYQCQGCSDRIGPLFCKGHGDKLPSV